jgi:hypothetical protein
MTPDSPVGELSPPAVIADNSDLMQWATGQFPLGLRAVVLLGCTSGTDAPPLGVASVGVRPPSNVWPVPWPPLVALRS